MSIFKRWFGRRQSEAPGNDENEFEEEYISYAEALVIAKRDAKRELKVKKDLISYVGYVESLGDFCIVEIRFGTTDMGEMTIDSLPPASREEDEQITDEMIGEIARAGNKIMAIRHYRELHSAGLAEAKRAVERLLDA